MAVNLDTKKLINGIITVEGEPVHNGMLISELERILKITVDSRDEFAGQVLPPVLVEEGKHIEFVAWFKGEKVENLKLNICGFNTRDEAREYLDNWLKNRGLEWIGSDEFETYYKTEVGVLMPSLVSQCYGNFDYIIEISLRNGESPSRKFSTIKEKKNNFINIMVDDEQYKIQRITCAEAEKMPYLHNWLGHGAFSLDDCREKPSKNDRKEIIYFNISSIKNGVESVIGVAEFTYLAIWEAYENSELFFILDDLTEEWGIIGHTVEKYGCGLENKKGITPYILAFEQIHDEIPHNKELNKFTKNENCIRALFNSAVHLTSKYVKVPEEDITLISVSVKKDKMFSYYKKCEDVFINYQRTVKNATVTKASGNASQNALKYQLNIPSEWAKQMGLTQEDKSVLMGFDGETITIIKGKN